jgi:uncharacterized Ntn-hydrolase superfamily protein
MGFAIAACDPRTTPVGVAVASRSLLAGSLAPHTRAGVGGAVILGTGEPGAGAKAVDLLATGLSPSASIGRLIAGTPAGDRCQMGMVDMSGRSAFWTGGACADWAGGHRGDGFVVLGCHLAGSEVVDAMLAGWSDSAGALSDRLLAALAAGDERGGDRRGRGSAAILVARGPAEDAWMDLRVDDHDQAIPELRRLWMRHRLAVGVMEP